MSINNEKDLSKAIQDGQETIEIEGDLKNKVIRIKATGKTAWFIAIGAIGIGIVGATYPVPEPTSQTVTKSIAFVSAPVAVGVLGIGATISAFSIAIAAGASGIAVLNKLRKYKIASNTDGKLILKKK